MKFAVIALALLALTPAAQADTIKCSYTEPFISTTYNSATRTLTVREDMEQTQRVVKNVDLRIASGGVLQIIKRGIVFQVLKLNDVGSDGMSDLIYPIEGKYLGLNGMANPLIGGCETDALKRSGER